MRKNINELIKEILNDKGENADLDITDKSNLRDLGLSSYDLAILTVNIEDEYDVDVFEDGVVETVGDIYEKVENKS